MPSATEISRRDPTSPQRLHHELSEMIEYHLRNNLVLPQVAVDAADLALLRFAQNVNALLNGAGKEEPASE